MIETRYRPGSIEGSKEMVDMANNDFDSRLRNPRTVLHWYDFLCPFCYVGQSRTTILVRHGLDVIELPFQAHPDIPPRRRSGGSSQRADVRQFGAGG